MIQICSKCHSRSYAVANLKAGDEVIREVDKIFADSIRTVKALYDDGILQKPEGGSTPPTSSSSTRQRARPNRSST